MHPQCSFSEAQFQLEYCMVLHYPSDTDDFIGPQTCSNEDVISVFEKMVAYHEGRNQEEFTRMRMKSKDIMMLTFPSSFSDTNQLGVLFSRNFVNLTSSFAGQSLLIGRYSYKNLYYNLLDDKYFCMTNESSDFHVFKVTCEKQISFLLNFLRRLESKTTRDVETNSLLLFSTFCYFDFDKKFRKLDFYHGSINREYAEYILIDYGDYLIRKNEKSEYVLTYKNSDKTCDHLLLDGIQNTGTFNNSLCQYKDFADFISQVVYGRSQKLCLKTPIPATRST